MPYKDPNDPRRAATRARYEATRLYRTCEISLSLKAHVMRARTSWAIVSQFVMDEVIGELKEDYWQTVQGGAQPNFTEDDIDERVLRALKRRLERIEKRRDSK